MGWLGMWLALAPAFAQDGHHVMGEATDWEPVHFYRRTVALVIGIGDYPGDELDLEYAVRDAEGVAETLGLYEFDEIVTLYDDEATRVGILGVLNDLSDQLADDDALFIFFAGHGTQRQGTGGAQPALVPYDGHIDPKSIAGVTNNIPMVTLTSGILEPMNSKHVFLVVDACYAGTATMRGLTVDSDGPPTLAHLETVRANRMHQILTAGGAGEQVLDGGPDGHSVFTGHFIRRLRETPDYILGSKLAGDVRDVVIKEAYEQNHTQTPSHAVLSGAGGDFVFIVRKQDVGALQQELDAAQAELARLRASNDPRVAELERREQDLVLRLQKQQALEAEQAAAAQRKAEEARLANQQADLTMKVAQQQDALAEERARQAIEGATASEVRSAALALEARMAASQAKAEAALAAQLEPLRAKRGKYESKEEYEARKAKLAVYEEQVLPWNARIARSAHAGELAVMRSTWAEVPPEELSVELGRYDLGTETFESAVVSWHIEGKRRPATAAFSVQIPRADAEAWEQEAAAGALQVRMKVLPRFREGALHQMVATDMVLVSPGRGQVAGRPARDTWKPYDVSWPMGTLLGCVDDDCFVGAGGRNDVALKVYEIKKGGKKSWVGGDDGGRGDGRYLASGGMDAVFGWVSGGRRLHIRMVQRSGDPVDASVLPKVDVVGYALGLSLDSYTVQPSGVFSASFQQWVFEAELGRVLKRVDDGWEEREVVPGLLHVSRPDGAGGVVLATSDGRLHGFDARTGDVEARGEYAVLPTHAFDVSSSGTTVLACDEDRCEVIDLARGRSRVLDVGKLDAAVLSPDGLFVAVASGTVTKLYETERLDLLEEIVVRKTGDDNVEFVMLVDALAFAYQGDGLLIGNPRARLAIATVGSGTRYMPLTLTQPMKNWR